MRRYNFLYDFHQISEILIFCIGNPIVNLRNFGDFDEFSIVIFKKILYREFNRKFPNLKNVSLPFTKIQFSHRILYQKSSGFFL